MGSSDPCVIDVSTLGGQRNPRDSMAFTEYCMGERVSSFR